MKSHTKPALRAMPATQVRIALPGRAFCAMFVTLSWACASTPDRRCWPRRWEPTVTDRVALCGPKGVPDATRRAVRGGTTASQVVLGGQRIAVRRPQARSVTEGEMALRSFEWAAGGDPLDAATMAAIAAGVSTRRYASTQEPVPAAHRPRAASKSAVSRRFVQLSQEQLAQWLARPLGDLDLPVAMIDDIHFRDRVILLTLGIDAQGNKHVLGLREGSTEATRVVASLLSDLVERGLDALVCATGFDTTQPLSSVEPRGSGGRTLREAWADGPEAYGGVTVACFSNLFLVLGPSTGTGHMSTLLCIESQVRHAIDAMRRVGGRRSPLARRPA